MRGIFEDVWGSDEMRIVHICLASHYTDGLTYQDNQLAEQNVLDGHQVLVVSDVYRYVNGELMEGGFENIVLPSGVHLVRLPYINLGSKFLSEKIRAVNGLYKLLDEFKPDVIMLHDFGHWASLDVVRYKRDYLKLKLYVDTHAAYVNSARNWLSLNILHKIIYRHLGKKVLPYVEKYFYVGEEEHIFAREVYKVPEEIMEYYPLGGFLPSDEEYERDRKLKREELQVADDELLLVHTGKMDAKKKTRELLRAFKQVPDMKAKLVIIGSLYDDVKAEVEQLIAEDSRVKFLGWKTGDEIQQYLRACDLYCQPGSVSATMQNAICNRCPVLSRHQEGYKQLVPYDNFVWTDSVKEIADAFRKIVDGEIDLAELKKNTCRCAEELLDYRKLAARIYR